MTAVVFARAGSNPAGVDIIDFCSLRCFALQFIVCSYDLLAQPLLAMLTAEAASKHNYFVVVDMLKVEHFYTL